MNSAQKSDELTIQISKAQLEKLQFEINELKNKKGWLQKILSAVPFLTLLIAIGGLWYNFHIFRETQIAQSKRDANSILIQFQQPYYQETMKIYQEVVDSASTLASAESVEAQNKSKEDFLRLFYGKAHFVADKDFSTAKVRFFNCYYSFSEECGCKPEEKAEKAEECAKKRREKLYELSQNLAEIAKDSLFKKYEIDKKYNSDIK